MRGEPRHRRSAPRGHEADGAVVIRGAESESAVLLRNLHAPGAELVQSFEERVVVFTLLINLVGIDVFGEEALETVEEIIGFGLVIRRLLGEGMNEIEIELTEKKIADERRLFPLGLARTFGDVHRIDGALGFDFGHEKLLWLRLITKTRPPQNGRFRAL